MDAAVDCWSIVGLGTTSSTSPLKLISSASCSSVAFVAGSVGAAGGLDFGSAEIGIFEAFFIQNCELEVCRGRK